MCLKTRVLLYNKLYNIDMIQQKLKYAYKICYSIQINAIYTKYSSYLSLIKTGTKL